MCDNERQEAEEQEEGLFFPDNSIGTEDKTNARNGGLSEGVVIHFDFSVSGTETNGYGKHDPKDEGDECRDKVRVKDGSVDDDQNELDEEAEEEGFDKVFGVSFVVFVEVFGVGLLVSDFDKLINFQRVQVKLFPNNLTDRTLNILLLLEQVPHQRHTVNILLDILQDLLIFPTVFILLPQVPHHVFLNHFLNEKGHSHTEQQRVDQHCA